MAKAKRLIRRSEVEALTGLRRSTIYNHIKTGRFPPPVKLGSRSVAWLEHEVGAWIAARVVASRSERAPAGRRSH
jgi:prophage regulatory protein